MRAILMPAITIAKDGYFCKNKCYTIIDNSYIIHTSPAHPHLLIKG
jgi:hypothetical protein